MNLYNVRFRSNEHNCDVIIPGVEAPSAGLAAFKVIHNKHYTGVRILQVYKLKDECAGCESEDCQDCCTHDEFDHDVCLYCGYERCPGIAIDRAMDAMEDR